MKFKIFTMLVILGILSVTPMIYMGKFDPMAFVSAGMGNGASALEQLNAKAPKNISSVVTDKKVQVYKWRDEHGVMQFSNTPPPTVSNAERIELNPNHNVIQAVKVPEKKEEPKEVAAAETPNPYSVRGMKKVMDDARGVEQLLQQRHDDQQKMLDGL
ncbi:MAG: DUF4124 domain-containing protein [Proteobacteria bacterium]|nr:DUF4124 domain-containing protein [Pseudomonadota bacterium]